MVRVNDPLALHKGRSGDCIGQSAVTAFAFEFQSARADVGFS